MSLENWQSNGWLRPHKTTASQIAQLLEIVDRDLKDAATARLSQDWQFGIAYNAALKLCTILLYAEGYRPEKNLAHYRTLQAMPDDASENCQQGKFLVLLRLDDRRDESATTIRAL